MSGSGLFLEEVLVDNYIYMQIGLQLIIKNVVLCPNCKLIKNCRNYILSFNCIDLIY